MPEGDTLFRIAHALRPVLVNRRAQLQLPRQGLLVQAVSVAAVEVHGKNLLIVFGDQRALLTHLKMTGVWHVYSKGMPWRRGNSQVVVTLETDAHCAVCFKAPTVRLLSAPQSKRLRSRWSNAAIDILKPHFDLEGVAKALVSLGEVPLGVALLEQSVVAGIGNVYKSEALFAAQANPFSSVGEHTVTTIESVLRTAQAMMLKNLPGRTQESNVPVGHYQYQRTTRSGCEVGKGPIAVYGRKGRACYRCGCTIEMRRQGSTLRSTYFCRQCQGVSGLG